jgi:hypothetical protein
MTNSIVILTVLSTNWLPMTVQAPNGDGTVKELQKEIGITMMNRYADVVADGITNKILLLSFPLYGDSFQMRDRKQVIDIGHTNWFITNWPPLRMWISNMDAR